MAATVQHEDSFIIFGGKSSNSAKTYIYDKDESQFVEILTTLSEEKAHLAAIKIKPFILKNDSRRKRDVERGKRGKSYRMGDSGLGVGPNLFKN